MNRTIVLLAAVIPLAACDSGPEVSATNATGQEVAEKVAKAGGTGEFVRPGKWASKVTIEDMSMPGMPPEAKAHMQGVIGRADTHESCLTPEEAKRPKEDFFAGTNKNCRYEHFNMGNGKIDAVMKCTEEGMGQTMTMAGTYSPDTYQMTMAMKSEGGAAAASGMTMKMRVDAKRVGECDGSEDA
jgi:uncharacterized protein DUF3617